MRNLLVCVAALAVASSAVGHCQEDLAAKEAQLKSSIDQLRDQAVEERVKLLKNISVNGRPLDPQEVMRETIYLTAGKLVEGKIADYFILDEMQKQVGNGRDPKDFLVDDAEVLADLDKTRKEFDAKYPGVDFWEVVRAQFGMDRETYLQTKRQQVRFDRAFFSGPPKDWPSVTREAVMANTGDANGAEFLKKLEESTAGVDAEGKPRKIPDFWLTMLRQFVQKGLREWSDIKYGSHGLAPSVVLSVNGHEWGTQEAFNYVKPGLFVQDIERALQEVVVREALRQELVAKNVYVDDAEFQRRYDEYRKPYDSTPFTVEVIATKFKGYPCLEAFRARWRLMTSYQDLIKDEINDENLQKHADKYQAFFAEGTASVDVIPFQARALRTGSWEPDGMKQAKEHCEEVFKLLQEKKLTFDQALEQKGEFFANDDKHGRLGYMPLNQIKQYLRENEFTQLLDGAQIASFLFFDAQIGKTYGPIQGPDGWYIARVNGRTPPHRKLDVKVQRERELVLEDYTTTRFMEWAGEVLKKTKVE